MKPITSRPLHLHLLLGAILLFVSSAHFTPEANAGYTATQKKLLRLHNEEREKRNKPRLKLKGALNNAASKYAVVMDANDHFDHTGPAPDFSTFDVRIEAEGPGLFTTMAENIALGQPTPEAVTKSWIKSPGHRRNILNKSFRFVGFGTAGTEPYWVANFGG